MQSEREKSCGSHQLRLLTRSPSLSTRHSWYLVFSSSCYNNFCATTDVCRLRYRRVIAPRALLIISVIRYLAPLTHFGLLKFMMNSITVDLGGSKLTDSMMNLYSCIRFNWVRGLGPPYHIPEHSNTHYSTYYFVFIYKVSSITIISY